MTQYTPDAGIPVLTEIITPLTVELDVSSDPVPAAAELQFEPDLESMPPVRLDEELHRIEHDVCERVLQQILTRIDFVLEQRVRDCFADVLQTSVERVADELRTGLQRSLTDVITRAVTLEISRLQSAKK